MPKALHFGPDYREQLELADGTPVVVRSIRPDDKHNLQVGLTKLSPETRYLRFFSDKSKLNKHELEYLTEVDGIAHFALVAEHATTGEGLGVARCVRLEEGVGEPALVVTDAYQGRGLGTVLLRRLTAAAVERGIETFVAEFLDRNDRIRALLSTISSEAEFFQDDEVVRAYLPLTEVSADLEAERRDGSFVYRLLGEVAAGIGELRHRLLALKGRE